MSQISTFPRHRTAPRRAALLALGLALALPPAAPALAQDLTGGKPVKTAKTCKSDRKFYLRRNIINTQTLKCTSPDKPANFSFTRDGISNSWNASANVSFGYAIGGLSLRANQSGGYRGALADSKLLIFGQLSGGRSSAGVTTGYTRFGLNYEAEFQRPGSALKYSLLDVTPYYQSDLNGKAAGYGLELAYTPAYSPANLNMIARVPGQRRVFYTTAVLRLDGYHAERPGGTALTAGGDYAWIGGDFGIGVQFFNAKKAKTVDLSLNVSAYHDLVSGGDSVMVTLEAEIPLNEAGNATLNITYKNGRTRQTLVNTDKLDVSLGVKF